MPQNLYRKQCLGISTVALTVILPLLTPLLLTFSLFKLTSGFGLTGLLNRIFMEVSERSDVRKALTASCYGKQKRHNKSLWSRCQ